MGWPHVLWHFSGLDGTQPQMGAFSQAVRAGNLLFLSGQIGIDPTTRKLVRGGIEAETRKTLGNVEVLLRAFGLTMNDLVRTTVYVTAESALAVVNKIYLDYFGAGPYPAREMMVVKGLALGASVEVTAIAWISERSTIEAEVVVGPDGQTVSSVLR